MTLCFSPPRDLDSKACVTIGEKVISLLFIFSPSLFLSFTSLFDLLRGNVVIKRFALRPQFGFINVSCKTAPVNIAAELNTSDCGQTGMSFIGLQAVKIFILNSSN